MFVHSSGESVPASYETPQPNVHGYKTQNDVLSQYTGYQPYGLIQTRHDYCEQSRVNASGSMVGFPGNHYQIDPRWSGHGTTVLEAERSPCVGPVPSTIPGPEQLYVQSHCTVSYTHLTLPTKA